MMLGTDHVTEFASKAVKGTMAANWYDLEASLACLLQYRVAAAADLEMLQELDLHWMVENRVFVTVIKPCFCREEAVPSWYTAGRVHKKSPSFSPSIRDWSLRIERVCCCAVLYSKSGISILRIFQRRERKGA